MRPITGLMYEIPPERVIGSSVGLSVRIWSRTAAPSSRRKTPTGAPALRPLIRHDDREREFDYTAGAEQALDLAAKEGWTIASIKDDWAIVFRDR